MDSPRSMTLFRHRFDDAEFDEARFELRVGGVVVDVQQKPLQLLALLLATPDELVTKEALYREVWGDRITVDNVLANAVSKLRSALGETAGQRVLTVPRQGYRISGPVERVAVGRRHASPLQLAAGMPVPGRERYVLATALGTSHTSETWLARHAKTGDLRVFKFALDGERLAELKRELMLHRVLSASLGPRDDIARVVDGNLEQPPCFLECEYGGDDLGVWARAEAEPGGPRIATLDRPARLALFLQIADAVAAAHSVAVLHKDLKPANILVAPRTGGWQLRLTDFGSGRLLEPGRLEELRITRLGLTLTSAGGSESSSGTPYYLAPELVGGAAPSVQSDVYALGVILYQLMVGDLDRPPAPGWERQIDDPLLREDIAGATDIDPAHRVPSAAQLAASLRNLDARRADAEQRAAEAGRAEHLQLVLTRARARRPWIAAAALALVLGLAASLWLYAGQRRAAIDLADQLELVQSLNRLLRDDLIGAANPGLTGRADITVADALGKAAAGIDSRFANRSPAIRASLHQSMQGALSELTRLKEAADEGRRALAAYRDAGLAASTDAQQVRLRLALDLVQSGENGEAARLMNEFDAAGPAAAQAPVLRAQRLFVASWLLDGKDSLKDGVGVLREAWALVEKLPDAEAPWRDKIAFALADNLVMTGEAREGEARFRELLARQSQALGDDHSRTLFTMVGLGRALKQQQRRAEAIALLQRAYTGLAARLGERHRMALNALDLLAETQFDAHDYDAAYTGWQQVHAGYVALLGERSSAAVTTQTNLGMARLHAGRAADAEPLLRAAWRQLGEEAGDEVPRVQGIRYHLADCLLDLGRVGEAAPLLERLDVDSLNVAEQQPDWPALIDYQRGRIALARGAWPQARALLAGAAAALAPHDAEAHITRAKALALAAKAEAQVAAR
jgi:non-specific serine/threonine protein kinase